MDIQKQNAAKVIQKLSESRNRVNPLKKYPFLSAMNKDFYGGDKARSGYLLIIVCTVCMYVCMYVCMVCGTSLKRKQEAMELKALNHSIDDLLGVTGDSVTGITTNTTSTTSTTTTTSSTTSSSGSSSSTSTTSSSSGSSSGSSSTDSSTVVVDATATEALAVVVVPVEAIPTEVQVGSNESESRPTLSDSDVIDITVPVDGDSIDVNDSSPVPAVPQISQPTELVGQVVPVSKHTYIHTYVTVCPFVV